MKKKLKYKIILAAKYNLLRMNKCAGCIISLLSCHY